MINIKSFFDYLGNIQTSNPGIITNIFLANSESKSFIIKIISYSQQKNEIHNQVYCQLC
jgi:hypothetical protein